MRLSLLGLLIAFTALAQMPPSVMDDLLLASTTCPTNLTSGLLGYWKLDEGANTTANDSIGTDAATLSGTPTPYWNSGYIGSAGLSFTPNSFLSCAQTQSLAAMSFSCWIWYTNIPSNYEVLFSYWATTYDTQLGVRNQTASSINLHYFFECATGYSQSTTGTISIPTNQWVFVAWTYSAAAGANCYVNGVFDNAYGAYGALVSPKSSFAFGKSVRLGRYVSCAMDDIRIYSRALTAPEVLYLYQWGTNLNRLP